MEIAPVSKAGAWDQWTYNSWDKYLPAVKAAKAKGAEQYIDIIGGHIYGNRPLYNMKKTAEIAAKYGKETWMTEHFIEGGDGTWNDELLFAQEVNESMFAGANAYVSWYMMVHGQWYAEWTLAKTEPSH